MRLNSPSNASSKAHNLIKSKKKSFLCCIFLKNCCRFRGCSIYPVHIFFVLIICLLTAFLAWLPSFLVNVYKTRLVANDLFQELEEKTENFIQHYLLEIQERGAATLKQGFEKGDFGLAFNPPNGREIDMMAVEKRLFFYSQIFQPTQVTVSMRNNRSSDFHAGIHRKLKPGILTPKTPEDVETLFLYKSRSSNDLKFFRIDSYNGTIISEITERLHSNFTLNSNWYQKGIESDLDKGLWRPLPSAHEIGFFETSHSLPLCNQTLLAAKISKNYVCEDRNLVVGVLRSNVNFSPLFDYLTTLVIPQDGKILVIEPNGNLVSFSQNLPGYSTSLKVHAETISEFGVGKLLKSIKNSNSDENSAFKFEQKKSFWLPPYTVDVKPFHYGELDFTIIVFFRDWDIYFSTFAFSAITVICFVSVAFCSAGFTWGFSFLLMLPSIRVKIALKKISNLDLNFKKMRGVFKENNELFEAVEKCREILAEYKSYLPQQIHTMIEQSLIKKRISKKNLKNRKNSIEPLVNSEENFFVPKSLNLEGIFAGHFAELELENIEKLKKTEFQTRKITSLLIKIGGFAEELEDFDAQNSIFIKFGSKLDISQDMSKKGESIQKTLSDFYTILDQIATATSGFLSSSGNYVSIYWNVCQTQEEDNHLGKALCVALELRRKFQENFSNLRFLMGIGQGVAQFGNIQIGEKRKVFEVVAPFLKRLKPLFKEAKKMNLDIVYNDSISYEVSRIGKFITRPVERYEDQKSIGSFHVLFELVGEAEGEDSGKPRLTEFDAEKKIYQKFEKAFFLVRNEEVDPKRIEEGFKILNEIESFFNKDFVFLKLLEEAEGLLQN